MNGLWAHYASPVYGAMILCPRCADRNGAILMFTPTAPRIVCDACGREAHRATSR